MSDNTSNIQLVKLDFKDIPNPVFVENKAKGYVSYGIKNDYPLYLLDLFENSAKHGAIVRGKADFIIGNGFEFVENNDNVDDKTNTILKKCNNSGESLSEVFSKVALDLELFAGGFVEILYNKKGQVSEIYHLDFTKVRISKDLETFYFAEDWFIQSQSDGTWVPNGRVSPEKIPAFDISNPRGKQVLFIREYSPQSTAYPKPNYQGALRYIEVDICISEYHLNGISNGMFASKLINFNNGVPEEEEQAGIERKVNGKFSGPKNAGKIMLSFNKSGDNAPTILDLSGTELDKHFDLLNKTVQTELFSGHRVTSPMLFGIKTEGQLGGRSELREAFELFQNTYINGKRNLIEKHINVILGINKIPTVYLQRSEPIGHEFSEGTIAKSMTEDEIRERLGLEPRAQEATGARVGSKLIKSIVALSPLVANKVIASMTTNEIRSIAGLPPIPGGDIIAPDAPAATPAQFSSDDLDDEKDFAIFSEYGSVRESFDIVESRKVTYEDNFQFYKDFFASTAALSDNQKSILDLIKKDSKITPEVISTTLDISVRAVNGLLKGMESDGLIKSDTVKDGEDTVTQRTPTAKGNDGIGNGDAPETTSIKVMYSYEGPEDSRNRPFCAKMLGLNRLFSRQEIESISSRVGYSVWNRRGGWYRPQGSTEARPYCRHSWIANTVVKKKK